MQKYISELLGTFFLVFFGCGSAIFAGKSIGILGISVTFGLTLMILIQCLGPISGCHLNPAVSVCFRILKKLSNKDTAYYIISQLVGSMIAGYVLYVIAVGAYDFDITKGFALNGYGEHSPFGFSAASCFLTEVILMTTLLYVILSTEQSKYAFIAIGSTLGIACLAGIPVTNASVNIARSFGVAIIHGGWALWQLWLFILAHIIGAGLAIGLFKTTHSQ